MLLVSLDDHWIVDREFLELASKDDLEQLAGCWGLVKSNKSRIAFGKLNKAKRIDWLLEQEPFLDGPASCRKLGVPECLKKIKCPIRISYGS